MLRKAHRLVEGERVRIFMSGDATIRGMFNEWTKPHPRVPLIGKKEIGAALISLPAVADSFMTGSAYEDARRKARRAAKAGFVVRACKASDHKDAILAINRSAPIRQGRSIWEGFLAEQDVYSYCERPLNCHGVFDAGGRLRGYVQWANAGEVFVFCRLMGHADDLKSGIMFLLVAEIVRQAIAESRRPGGPRWLQYSMYWDGTDGMRRFKRELGFRPYRVTWRWRETQTPPEPALIAVAA
jgi:hypothetical protein